MGLNIGCAFTVTPHRVRLSSLPEQSEDVSRAADEVAKVLIHINSDDVALAVELGLAPPEMLLRCFLF